VDIRAFGYLIRDHWKLIALVVVLAVGISAAITARTTPRYASNVTFYVSASPHTSNPTLAYEGILLAQQAVLSYADLLTSPRLASSVVSQLRLPMTAPQVAAEIKATPVPQSVLLTATVTDTSPRRAQLIAAAVGTQFVKLVSALQRSAGGQQATIQAVVVGPANRPSSPVSPKPAKNIGIALVIGLAVGVALAAARRSFDTRIKSTDQLTALTGGKPVIGAIPFDPAARKYQQAANRDVSQQTLEAYRKIRVNLQSIDVAGPSKALLFTSPLPEEGKSSVVCNLAIALAQSGQRIIVVETDLRRPRVAGYLGLPKGPGVTDVLAGKADVDEVIQTWDNAPVNFLDSGAVPPSPSDLLSSQRMKELITWLRQYYDVILLDAPPVLPFADAAAIAPASDGAILVVRFGKARSAQVQQATEALSAVGTPVLGNVLTMTPARQRAEYGYRPSGYQPVHDGHGPRRISAQPDQTKSGGGG